MEQKDTKWLIEAAVGVGVLLLLILVAKPQNYVRIADNSSAVKKDSIAIAMGWEVAYSCPYFLTRSQHGDINLPVGTIFGYPAKSGENIYDIIRDDTFIMSYYFIEGFKKDFKCFKTEEEAVAMGYKKFLSNQAARKEARAEAKKFLDEQRAGGNATDTAKTLRAIDALIGL